MHCRGSAAAKKCEGDDNALTRRILLVSVPDVASGEDAFHGTVFLIRESVA